MQGLRSEPESPQQFVSIDRESREFAAPAFQSRENSITSLALTKCFENSIEIRVWLLPDFWALCSLLLWYSSSCFPERHTTTAILSGKASQAECGSPRNENVATRFRSIDLNENLSTSAVTLVMLPLVEQRSNEVRSLRNGGRDNGI